MKIVVVGGGISGVSAAYLLKKHTHNDVILVEKEKTVGGKASTLNRDGYLIETGPNGFLDNKQEIKLLIEESNFENNVIESKDESRRRFIFSQDRLYELRENPIKLLSGNFLSMKGRLRILKEPFIKTDFNDETLESFVVRRLGREMLDKLIGPMACGVYAGDPAKMSMEATFGRIKDIEKQYGSLIKGLLGLMKKKKASASSAAGPFSAKLMSFKMGLGSFINHLSQEINVINDEVVSFEKKKNSKYELRLANGTIEAESVVFALPSYALSDIVRQYDCDFSKTLNLIEYAPLNVVSFGFDRNNLPEIVNSFGYLFNLNDIKDVIGVLFDSSIFKNRAQNDKLLVRIMVGGDIKRKSAFRKNIYETAVKELQRSAEIFTPFEYAHSMMHQKAIPQYYLNHKYIVEQVKNFENLNRGVFIIGNAFYGVSLNDCVKAAYNLMEKII